MNNNYIIATDSACDLPAQFCKEKGIETAFISYVLGDETFVDTMEVSSIKDFYEQMKDGAVFKTSQINYTEYYEFFKRLVATGEQVLYVGLSSGMSGSYNNAKKAAEDINAEMGKTMVYAVDSLLASAGLGMQAIKALEMRDSGVSIEDNAKYIEDNRLKVHAYYTTNTLKYFVRGGRVSKVSGAFGAMLKINPIMNVTKEGELKIVSKAIGKKAAEKGIKKHVVDNVINASEQTLYVSHADALEDAMRFGEELKQAAGFKDVFYTYIGTTIGAHTGPALKAIFFSGTER